MEARNEFLARIALQAEPMLLTDVGEKDHIITLSLAHWAHPPSTEPA